MAVAGVVYTLILYRLMSTLLVDPPDGIGFGITHSMVTLMFEQAMQLVNPKLALPYWDFTIDGHLVESLYEDDYSHLRDVSDLWTPEWFGSVDPVDFQVRRLYSWILT